MLLGFFERRSATMFSRSSLAVLLTITTLTGCSSAQSQNNGKTATQPAAKTNFVIRKAVYGDLPDGTALDVTDKVRAMVKNGTLSVVVTDKNLGDPYNGTMELTIIRAEIRVRYLNLGGAGGAGDITD